jgi:threonine/homoserine efflux transporter RhtA
MSAGEPSDLRRRVGTAITSLGTIVVAALVPKCPLCIAAALSVAGCGAAAAGRIAPLVRPLGLVFALVAMVVFARYEWRRRQRAVRCGNGCHAGRSG